MTDTSPASHVLAAALAQAVNGGKFVSGDFYSPEHRERWIAAVEAHVMPLLAAAPTPSPRPLEPNECPYTGSLEGGCDPCVCDLAAAPASPPSDAESESSGPYTCIRCLAGTWNDDDVCDDCRSPEQPTGEKLREALRVCDRVLHFDLKHMIEWGPDYNQAVKDAADTVRKALGEQP